VEIRRLRDECRPKNARNGRARACCGGPPHVPEDQCGVGSAFAAFARAGRSPGDGEVRTVPSTARASALAALLDATAANPIPCAARPPARIVVAVLLLTARPAAPTTFCTGDRAPSLDRRASRRPMRIPVTPTAAKGKKSESTALHHRPYRETSLSTPIRGCTPIRETASRQLPCRPGGVRAPGGLPRLQSGWDGRSPSGGFDSRPPPPRLMSRGAELAVTPPRGRAPPCHSRGGAASTSRAPRSDGCAHA